MSIIRFEDLGVYKIEEGGREILTISERFKRLSRVDQDFLRIIHDDFATLDLSSLEFLTLFRGLRREYDFSRRGLIVTYSRDCPLDLHRCERYRLQLGFTDSPFLKNLSWLTSYYYSYKQDPPKDITKINAKRLAFYTEKVIFKRANDWIKEKDAGNSSVYSKRGRLFLDYLNSLVVRKWKELVYEIEDEV